MPRRQLRLPTFTAEPSKQPAANVADAAKAGQPTDAKAQKQADNVRVPALRLDEMMDRVGELVIAQSRLSQMASSVADLGLRSVSEEIERLAGELRDTMMVLRMMPVASLFSRFRRLVHDLARETGKDIELITEGEMTEVDKTVIDRLADPLVHLVRNSVDHGLETPEDRIAAGKPAVGAFISPPTRPAAKSSSPSRMTAAASTALVFAPRPRPTVSSSPAHS